MIKIKNKINKQNNEINILTNLNCIFIIAKVAWLNVIIFYLNTENVDYLFQLRFYFVCLFCF
jgi:hypothetical protein